MIKKNFDILKVKRILKTQGYIIKRNSKTLPKQFSNFLLTTSIALCVILLSGVAPKLINFYSATFMSSETVENNSNINFKKTLDGKSILTNKSEESEIVNYTELFFDIFNFDKLPEDVVRFNASTLEQIFKDNGYILKEIREGKTVKPVKINLLPRELKQIESVKKRKNFFIKIILPLILEENTRIKLERKKLFSIINKNINSIEEKNWLKNKFKQYGVVNNDLATLKIRMDEIPVSLAIAQAAKETGWGTSRFALEGNALFGQWTYNGEGIKPAAAENDSTHKVMKFKILQASVRAYQRNLNTHSGYKEFRRVRAIQRENNGKLDSLELVDYLDKYAETGKEYTKILKMIIKQNQLTDFDESKLMPTSDKLKKLI